MIGDPSGKSSRAQAARRRDHRGQLGGPPAAARALPRLHAGAGPAAHGRQPRLAGVDVRARLPARHRQALHGALHAGQGLRPGAPGGRHVLHRVQLPDPPGGRLPASPPRRRASRCRWAAPTSGATSRPASSSSGASRARDARARDAAPRLRALQPAAADALRPEDGQDREGRGLPRPALTSPYDFYQYWLNDDDAARPRSPALADHAATREHRGHRGRAGRTAGGAPRAAGPRVRPHRARPRRARRPIARCRVAAAAFAADRRRPGRAGVAASRRSAASSSGRRRRPGRSSTWPSRRAAHRAREARRLISQGGLSVNGERLADPTRPPPALIAGRYWWVSLGKKRRVVGRRSRLRTAGSAPSARHLASGPACPARGAQRAWRLCSASITALGSRPRSAHSTSAW